MLDNAAPPVRGSVLVTLDARPRIVLASAEWLAMFGLQAHACTGRTLGVVSGPETESRKLEKLVDTVRLGKRASTATVLYTPLGDSALFAVHAMPGDGPAGQPVCELHVRKGDGVSLEAAMSEDGKCKLVVAACAPFRVLGMTTEFEHVFGFPRELALNRTPGFIQGPETDLVGWLALFDSALAGVAAQQTVNAYTCDGTLISRHMHVCAVLEARGGVRYLLMDFSAPGYQRDVGRMLERRPERRRADNGKDTRQTKVVGGQRHAHDAGKQRRPRAGAGEHARASERPPVREGGSGTRANTSASKSNSDTPWRAPVHSRARGSPSKAKASGSSESPLRGRERHMPATKMGARHADAKVSMGSVSRLIEANLERARAQRRATRSRPRYHELEKYGYRRGDGVLRLLWALVFMVLVTLRILSPPPVASGDANRRRKAERSCSLGPSEERGSKLHSSHDDAVFRPQAVLPANNNIIQDQPHVQQILRSSSDPSGSAGVASTTCTGYKSAADHGAPSGPSAWEFDASGLPIGDNRHPWRSRDDQNSRAAGRAWRPLSAGGATSETLTDSSSDTPPSAALAGPAASRRAPARQALHANKPLKSRSGGGAAAGAAAGRGSRNSASPTRPRRRSPDSSASERCVRGVIKRCSSVDTFFERPPRGERDTFLRAAGTRVVFVCVCRVVCVCVRVCVCVCIYMYMYVYVCMYVCIFSRIYHTHAQTKTHTYTCTRARARARTHTHTYSDGCAAHIERRASVTRAKAPVSPGRRDRDRGGGGMRKRAEE